MKTKLTPFRGVLLALTGLLLLWFLLPVGLGVLSLANVAGVGVLALLGWAILCWPRLRAWLKTAWRKRGMRVLLIVLAVLAAGLAGLTGVLVGKAVSGMKQPESQAETVIVLGCQVRGEQPSLLLRHRIDAAADYLRAHPNARCIVSGGQGSGERITEAECMQRELIRSGIEPERIFAEPESTSTVENLVYSQRIMAREGMTTPVLLVSNNFHIYRALRIAEQMGLPAEGLPASCEWYMLPTYLLREAMAMVKLGLFH